MICTDLHLICTLQITANQALSIFTKHCKTRANQRKSLQITSLQKHWKNNVDLQARGRVTGTGLAATPPDNPPSHGIRLIHCNSQHASASYSALSVTLS